MAQNHALESASNPLWRILIADDHALVRGGLALIIESASPGTEIYQASSFDQVAEFLDSDDNIDLLLLDIMMPGMEGGAGIKRICERWPELPVVIVSVKEDAKSIREALSVGAMGFIPKSSLPSVTISAVQLVLSGGIYVPPHVLALSKPPSSSSTSEETDDTNDSRAVSIQEDIGSHEPLTRRQKAVLELIVAGKSNKTIADDLGLTVGTVKMHVSGILKRMGVSSRTEAIAQYSKMRTHGASPDSTQD